MGGPDAAAGVPGLDHHQPDLYHLNRIDTGRSIYHSAPCMGIHKAAQASQASNPGVVEVLGAWLGIMDDAPKTSG